MSKKLLKANPNPNPKRRQKKRNCLRMFFRVERPCYDLLARVETVQTVGHGRSGDGIVVDVGVAGDVVAVAEQGLQEHAKTATELHSVDWFCAGQWGGGGVNGWEEDLWV